MADPESWLLRLDQHDIDEIERALAVVNCRNIQIPALSRVDFEAPRLAEKIHALQRELEEGRGFVVIRGLPVERYSKADAAKIYWAIGSYMGPAFAQNAQGDVLGHVRDLGADWRTQSDARGYQTRFNLPFHNDSTDIVGLLCLQKAKTGDRKSVV